MILRSITIDELKVGMVAAKDVYSHKNEFLIAKGTIITSNVIELLRRRDSGICVPVEDYSEDNSLENAHKRELQNFKETQEVVAGSLKNSMNEIIEKNIDNKSVQKVIEESIGMYRQNEHSYSLFSMIHELRENSDETYVHSINVGMIAAMIGKWSGFSEEECELLISCGLFHDIGKLMIPEKILHKPGRLTEPEFKIMKSHALKGYELLKDLDINDHIKLAALEHHEKFNGSGYPLGMTGDKMDKYAKIIAVADVYDAMTANRVYRAAMCPFKVIEIFESEGYELYDAQSLIIFLKNVVNTYINEWVKLSNGENGKIIRMNDVALSKPIIMVNDQFIDLSTAKGIDIEEIVYNKL